MFHFSVDQGTALHSRSKPVEFCMKKVNIVTLGCSKNVVDSEYLATQLEQGNIEFTFNEFNNEADTVVINTCGFIADAKEESIQTILSFAEAKTRGEIKNLFVMGCLSERYRDIVSQEIPEADAIFGVNDLPQIVASLQTDYKKDLLGSRTISTPPHYAYLKISEGCNRRCAFCAIPKIRGKHRSVPPETLENEARFLVSRGVKELMLIAQDLTFYGMDLFQKPTLPDLMRRLSKIENLYRLRLHYAYPALFPEEILTLMSRHTNIANYLDIPFQHISDTILQKMRRGHTHADTLNLIQKCRKLVPNIALRTTLIVGYPGETEKDFQVLTDFVRDTRFDRLGVFTYSEEEDTYAAKHYEDKIPENEKQARADEIMQLQEQISYEKNYEKIGQTLSVIIDKEENEFYIGRTEYDSPEVDNEVLINKDKKMLPGEIYPVKITDAAPFDLYGEYNE